MKVQGKACGSEKVGFLEQGSGQRWGFCWQREGWWVECDTVGWTYDSGVLRTVISRRLTDVSLVEGQVRAQAKVSVSISVTWAPIGWRGSLGKVGDRGRALTPPGKPGPSDRLDSNQEMFQPSQVILWGPCVSRAYITISFSPYWRFSGSWTSVHNCSLVQIVCFLLANPTSSTSPTFSLGNDILKYEPLCIILAYVGVWIIFIEGNPKYFNYEFDKIRCALHSNSESEIWTERERIWIALSDKGLWQWPESYMMKARTKW